MAIVFPSVENANQASLLFSQNVVRRFLKRDVIGLTLNALVIHKECLNMEYIISRSHGVSCNEARVFHYRNCPAPCGMPADMEVDITLQKYGERLKKKLNHPIIHKKM